jgi:peptidoglycan/xylan/chitin deacetylase (PgdA/CDA1 family)
MQVPLISTVHGIQKPSLSKKYWPMYGERIITVCDNIKQQLLTQLQVQPRLITTVPNGFEFAAFPVRQRNSVQTLVMAGRMTGPKGVLMGGIITNVLPVLLVKNETLQVQVFGGDLELLPQTVQNQWLALEQAFPARLQWGGFVSNLETYLAQASCVIGSGRIAIAALAIGVPTIAVGEAEYIGVVTQANLADAVASNFGDIGFPQKHKTIDYTQMSVAISKTLDTPENNHSVQDFIYTHYELNNVYKEILELYRQARMLKCCPRHIPVLMYHKVLPQAEKTQHRIFVTVKQFNLHMRFLAWRGFSAITFADYFVFRDGKRPLTEFPRRPIIITFDDGYENNLQYALPILQKYNFKAVLYALGNSHITHNVWDANLGEPRHELLTEQGLQKMHAAGIEIGAHSMTHTRLTQISADLASQEIIESKQRLEAVLKTPIISFAYPYGAYNDQIKQLTQQAGFYCAVATDTGGVFLEDDLFAIFRVNMMPRDGTWEIFKKSSSAYRQRYWRKRGH